MSLSLKFNLSNIKKYLPLLRKLEPYVFGLALVALFGYTALVVNKALNVEASTVPAAADPNHPASAKITFDKNTIEAVKKLSTVNGDVPVKDLGKDDPFK